MRFLYKFLIFELLLAVVIAQTGINGIAKTEVSVTTPKPQEMMPVTIPSTAAPTTLTTTTTTTLATQSTTASSGFDCVSVGFFAMENSCDCFYYCMRSGGVYVPYELKCPSGQNYMAGLNYCSSTYACSVE